jgi:hypothetical protein
MKLPFLTAIAVFVLTASQTQANALNKLSPETIQVSSAMCVEEIRFRESETINLHKYYLSVSNVTYSSKAKALQMTTRFFIDDLEDVLSEQSQKKLVLNNNQDILENKAALASYLEKKMEVTADKRVRAIIYLGGEIENDQVVLYIEIPVSNEPTSITMKFTAFQELFEEQKNMVHFKLQGKRVTLLMTKEKQTDSLKLS